MWVLSPELVLNLVLNLVSMDTKFSAGGNGSHLGKHGIAAQTGCSKTRCSAAPHMCFSSNFAIIFIFVAYTDLRRYFACSYFKTL